MAFKVRMIDKSKCILDSEIVIDLAYHRLEIDTNEFDRLCPKNNKNKRINIIVRGKENKNVTI